MKKDKMIQQLTELYYRVYGYKSIEAPPSPITGGDGPHVEVSVYRSVALDQRNGVAPAQSVARYYAEALDRAGFSYTVHHDLRRIETLSNDPHNDDLMDWWRTYNRPVDADHSNMLLLDAPGAGRAGLKAWYGVAPARYISYQMPILNKGLGDEYRNMRACIHELGHNLGGRHEDNMLSPPEMWFNDSAIDDFHETVEAQDEKWGEGGRS